MLLTLNWNAHDTINNRNHILYKFTFQRCEDGIHVLHTITASNYVTNTHDWLVCEPEDMKGKDS